MQTCPALDASSAAGTTPSETKGGYNVTTITCDVCGASLRYAETYHPKRPIPTTDGIAMSDFDCCRACIKPFGEAMQLAFDNLARDRRVALVVAEPDKAGAK